MAYKDYYATLGVPKAATADEIKRAYRKLAKQYHPDRNKGKPEAESRFKDINEAYEVLSDPEKRGVYDTYGTDKPPPPPPPGGWQTGSVGSGFDAADFSDFFRDLFGGGGVRGGNFDDLFGPGRVQGFGRSLPQDVEGAVPVGLQEAYRGTSRTVEVAGRRLEFKVPPGARDGQRMRLAGQAPGGGNVLLTVRLEPDPVFRLEGDDLRVTAEVPAPVAVVGGKASVPTLDGEVEVTVPPRSQTGRTLRLRGQGWPKKDGSRGDELVELRVTVPRSPTPEQETLYRQLAELE